MNTEVIEVQGADKLTFGDWVESEGYMVMVLTALDAFHAEVVTDPDPGPFLFNSK